ncbi:hypothetical protein V2J09_012310 [Rumex salicifolius]
MEKVESEVREDRIMEAEVIKQNPKEPVEATLSKRAQKKLVKQQQWQVKKAAKKAQMKELKNKKKEEKRLEWDQKLSVVSEEEKLRLFESRKCIRKERMDRRTEEKEKKIERLTHAKLHGQNVVIDLQFSDLMTPSEINSLSQQFSTINLRDTGSPLDSKSFFLIMYCYAVNSRCACPAHLWLTACTGDMDAKLQTVPGFEKWMIEKEKTSYIEALHDRKDKLVYLSADAETVLDDLDLNDIYIIGGLVDRNRWKGITLKKAQEEGIRTAKLPIGNYLKMSSSQVLTVNQVVEILLKYLDTRDWKASFFEVIPQRKRCDAGTDENGREAEDEKAEDKDTSSEGQKKIKISSEGDDGAIESPTT